MSRRLATLAAWGLLLLALAACDFFYVATARVPLAITADTSCLRSELGAGTRYSRLEARGVADGRARVVAYATPAMFHNEWQTVTEARWRDSSVYQGAVALNCFNGHTIEQAVFEHGSIRCQKHVGGNSRFRGKRCDQRLHMMAGVSGLRGETGGVLVTEITTDESKLLDRSGRSPREILRILRLTL